jgi:hypothetical protein
VSCDSGLWWYYWAPGSFKHPSPETPAGDIAQHVSPRHVFSHALKPVPGPKFVGSRLRARLILQEPTQDMGMRVQYLVSRDRC